MDWQTLNVGVLAFISSMVAFNISKFHAHQQRQREFIAARSFLPEALSELSSYFKENVSLLLEAWARAKDETDDCKTPLQNVLPSLPDNYREIFSRCISLAEPEVAQYLSFILMRLQVQHARVKALNDSFNPNSTMLVLPQNIITYLYGLAELQALVGKIFNFSRGLKDFSDDRLSWDDFRSAYFNLGILFENYDDLEDFTKRAINRSKGEGYTV